MNKLTKLSFLGLALATMLGLSACGGISDGDDYKPGDTYQFTATLDDGTKVPCIKIQGLYGIDCNWAKAERVKQVAP